MAPLQTYHDLRRAIFYSSKLLKQPASVLGGLSKQLCEPRKFPDEPRRSLIDLYTVLPKAKSEPVYVKSDWERELEAALKEARAHGQLTKCDPKNEQKRRSLLIRRKASCGKSL